MCSSDLIQKFALLHGPFDVVIDDSAHTDDIAQNIADAVWPLFVKPGGWFIVEDINSNYENVRSQGQFVHWARDWVLEQNEHGKLIKAAPQFRHPSNEIAQIIYVPGLMAVQRMA